MLGGPTMNLLIYLVLTVILLCTLGIGTTTPTTTVSAVVQVRRPGQNSSQAAEQLVPGERDRRLRCNVLKPGDVIVAIDGTRITNWDDAVAIVERSAGKTLSMTVRRNGIEQQLSITPVREPQVRRHEPRRPRSRLSRRVAADPHYYAAAAGNPGTGIHRLIRSARASSAIGSYPSKIAQLWGTVFEGKPRDPTGAIGVVGIGRIGGDIAAEQRVQRPGQGVRADQPAGDREPAAVLLQPAAAASARRWTRGRCTRRGGQARPGETAGTREAARGAGGASDPDAANAAAARRRQIYVDTAQMVPVMYAVASVLILVTLLVVYADIVKPVTLGG